MCCIVYFAEFKTKLWAEKVENYKKTKLRVHQVFKRQNWLTLSLLTREPKLVNFQCCFKRFALEFGSLVSTESVSEKSVRQKPSLRMK